MHRVVGGVEINNDFARRLVMGVENTSTKRRSKAFGSWPIL
jgi:hypothetical protein